MSRHWRHHRSRPGLAGVHQMTDTYRAMCAELVDAIFTPISYNWEDNLYEAADRARALLAQPVAEGADKAHPFVVRHYTDDDRPSIKGNGFDGLEIGEDRQEAEEFITWINERICPTPQPVAEGPTDEELLRLAREWNSGFESIELHFAADYARAVLAKWGRQ